jgi:hypothetical protein
MRRFIIKITTNRIIKSLTNHEIKKEYLIENEAKFDYLPSKEYSQLKGISNHAYKNLGLSSKKTKTMSHLNKEMLKYNDEAEKFLFGKY